jgi:hypothetical protein
MNKSTEIRIVESLLNQSNDDIEKFSKNWSDIEIYFGKSMEEILSNMKWYYKFIADLKKYIFRDVDDLKVNGTSRTDGYQIDNFVINDESYSTLLHGNPDISEFLRPAFVNKFGGTCQDVIDFINKKTKYNDLFNQRNHKK